MNRTTRRASAVVLAVASSVLVAVPALADSTDPSVVGNDPTTMSVANAVLLFAGIPIALALIIWLLVSAPGWTRRRFAAWRPTRFWNSSANALLTGPPSAAKSATE